MFGEQLLAFQDWTRWSNLVKARSVSNKMNEKGKRRRACRGKRTANFNSKAPPDMLLAKMPGCFWEALVFPMMAASL